MATYQPGLSIAGLQQAQEHNLRYIAALRPTSAPGVAVQWAAGEFHRWWTYFTPWDTGALRASRRITFNNDVPRAQIFDSRNSYNPRSKTPPWQYDVYLHNRGMVPGIRGGIQASLPYTVWRKGKEIQQGAGKVIINELRKIK